MKRPASLSPSSFGAGHFDRPSLAEALYDLLDEAEIESVFGEWCQEVVLCGHFTRADITVFRDFKQFRHQLQAVNGTLATTARPVAVKLPLKKEKAEQCQTAQAPLPLSRRG